jgi:hypothetical protein
MASVQEIVEKGMNVEEMVANGISKREAELEMAKRVFGEDVQFDRHGKPIEQGKGSLVQPTEQSFQALLKAEGSAAEAAARARAAKYNKGA